MLKFLREVFDFRPQNKQILYIILLAFMFSFFGARGWSVIVGNGIYVEGYHIHHFFFGAIVLSIGGVLGVLSRAKKGIYISAALIGLGMGLFADEIGLLLNCTTANRICAYAFTDELDIIGTIGFILVLLIIYVGLLDVYEGRKKNKDVRNEPDRFDDSNFID